MKKQKKKKQIIVEVIRDEAGQFCLAFNKSLRVAGPKIYGEGKTVHSFHVNTKDIEDILKEINNGDDNK